MANRSFANVGRIFAPHTMPVLIDCNFTVGAAGAVGTLKGPMVSAVTRLAAGVYKVKFQDNYYKYFGGFAQMIAPVSGANVLATALTPGVVYQITALGTTTDAQWVTAGVPVGITPAVGVSFLCAAASLGTGTAKILGASGIQCVEVIGTSANQLNPIGNGNMGGYVIVKCLGATAAGDTTLIATDPADGSTVQLAMYLSNSSVVVQGE